MPVQTPEETLGLEKLPPTLTPKQVAAVLGISKQTVYRAVDSGEFPSIIVRGSVRVPSWHVEDLLATPED